MKLRILSIIILTIFPNICTAGDLETYHDEFGTRFRYDSDRWHVASPAEHVTQFVIQWTGEQSGGLIANCFLQVSQIGEGWGRYSSEFYHLNAEMLANLLLRKERRRAPEAILEEYKNLYADNVPVLFTIIRAPMKYTDSNFQVAETTLILLGFHTTWKQRWQSLTCSYSSNIESEPVVHEFVINEINKVMVTWQFEQQ